LCGWEDVKINLENILTLNFETFSAYEKGDRALWLNILTEQALTP
jgi:hypothetical protein